MVKTALNYLILAHDNFDHLDHLIDALDGEEIYFYVHIDKKTTAPYKNSKANVTITKDRVPVHWGKFGVVRATLHLLELAYKKGKGGRYILLSGSDYPVRPNAFIREVLQGKAQFINILPVPLPHKPIARFEHYHINFDSRKKNLSNRLLGKLQTLLKHKSLKRKIPFQLYAGSQWFALTHDCVGHILQEVDSNPGYKQFFQYTEIPDESFFHTIIGNSRFYVHIKNSMTFMQWNGETSPARISKKEIDFLAENIKAHYKTYGSYTPLFARKFDAKNAHLLPLIDSTLLKQAPHIEPDFSEKRD